MEEILQRWKKHAIEDEEKNFLFIRSLKLRDAAPVDAMAKKLHKEAFEKIDCVKCGNCCKVSKPLLLEEDIQRIAEHLQISIAQLIADYLEKDEYGDWTTNTLPCPFFNQENNNCTIYTVRPKDCQEFPHTNKKRFASRSYGHSYNTLVCPATHYIVERMKEHFS